MSFTSSNGEVFLLLLFFFFGGGGNVTFENYCILRSNFVGTSENEFQASSCVSYMQFQLIQRARAKISFLCTLK